MSGIRRSESMRHWTQSRRSFTLVELLVVLAIIAVLASAVLMAAWGAQEDARVTRTRTQIAKINELIMNRWETYRTRPVPIRTSMTAPPGMAASNRLFGLREMMRFELPERQTDVNGAPVTLINSVGLPTAPRLALHRNYRRRVAAAGSWSATFEGAECLYMIVASMRDGDTSGTDFLQAGEIGDVDSDGMREILDAWGNPIEFLRWAPGVLSEMQTRNPATDPDPFDPLKMDPRMRDATGANDTFALFPLILSAGRDGGYDMLMDYTPANGPLNYSIGSQAASGLPNDPYFVPSWGGPQIGAPFDTDADGQLEYEDNITNHLLSAP